MRRDMESRTLYADTLRIAADTLGGSRNLARRLGVPPDELESWMSGRKLAPLEPFLTALEIIEV
jgi:hypothetical protein